MYNAIAANKTRTLLLFVVVFGLVSGIGYLFSVAYNNPIIFYIAITLAAVQSWVAYFMSDQIALATSGAKPTSEKTEPTYWHLVENLTITAGLPMPKLYIIEDQAINAFATGRDPKHAALAVTRGALDRLEKVELEGVLAHELSHVQNRDILVMTVAVTLIGVVSILANFMLRMAWFGGGRRRDNEGGSPLIAILAILAALFAPLIGTLIQLAISRRREYLADASGALLTRYPDGLADALEKIANDRQQLRTASNATAHLFIANPFKATVGQTAANLFSTHPPVQDRIRRLREMGH